MAPRKPPRTGPAGAGPDEPAHEPGCACADCFDKKVIPFRSQPPEASPAARREEPRPGRQAARPSGKPDRAVADATDEPDTLVIRSAEMIWPRLVEWLWPQRFPLGKLSLLVGDPDVGKSLLTLDLAARISTGRPWPDGTPCPQGRVLLLSAEDDPEDTIIPRLLAAGADRKTIKLIEATRRQGQERLFSLAADLPLLAAALQQYQPRAVILDPLNAYLGDIDANKDVEVRSVLTPLAQLAGAANVTVLGVMHLNKSQQQKVLYRIGGSIAFMAVARAVFTVVKEEAPSPRRLFGRLKSNLGPEPPALAFTVEPTETSIRVQWADEPVPAAEVTALLQAEGDPEADEKRSRREDAKEFLLGFLADGPQEQRAIKAAAKAEGCEWPTVDRAARELRVRRTRKGHGQDHRGLWSLPSPEGDSHQNPPLFDASDASGQPLVEATDSGGDFDSHHSHQGSSDFDASDGPEPPEPGAGDGPEPPPTSPPTGRRAPAAPRTGRRRH